MASTVTNAACKNWVSRGSDWRSDAKGTDRICQGWQGTSYGQTKTFMTVMTFTVPANEVVKTLSFKLKPSGGFGSSYNKTLKIVRPHPNAPKTFTSSTSSESVRPTSDVTLQTATIKNGTSYTITANQAVLDYLAEGYNYIVICDFANKAYTSGYEYSYSYINCTGATCSYTTDSAGVVKIWNGSSWVNAIPHIWNGSSWVKAIPHVWNGSQWVIGKG